MSQARWVKNQQEGRPLIWIGKEIHKAEIRWVWFIHGNGLVSEVTHRNFDRLLAFADNIGWLQPCQQNNG
jgi:hypothetical protein